MKRSHRNTERSSSESELAFCHSATQENSWTVKTELAEPQIPHPSCQRAELGHHAMVTATSKAYIFLKSLLLNDRNTHMPSRVEKVTFCLIK